MKQRKNQPQPPPGVKTQGECSGHELCNQGKCNHRPPWWRADKKR